MNDLEKFKLYLKDFFSFRKLRAKKSLEKLRKKRTYIGVIQRNLATKYPLNQLFTGKFDNALIISDDGKSINNYKNKDIIDVYNGVEEAIIKTALKAALHLNYPGSAYILELELPKKQLYKIINKGKFSQYIIRAIAANELLDYTSFIESGDLSKIEIIERNH